MITIVAVGNVGSVQLGDVNGESVLNFRLAVNHKKQETTTWFSCAFWGKRAQLLSQYVQKGSKICISGSFSTREFDGKTQLDVRVTDIELCGSKPEDRGF